MATSEYQTFVLLSSTKFWYFFLLPLGENSDINRLGELMVCSAPSCDRPVLARSLCVLHYRRVMRHGFLTRNPTAISTNKTCSRCQTEKPRDEFYNLKHGVCKKCCSILNTCRKFNITYDLYRLWLQQQNNQCGVCAQLFTETPHLDHNHKTGDPRGFVCRDCNILLGILDRAKEELQAILLTAAAAYRVKPPIQFSLSLALEPKQ